MTPQLTVYAIERTDKGHPQWFTIEHLTSEIEVKDTGLAENFWTNEFNKATKWTSKEDAEECMNITLPRIGKCEISNLVVTEHVIVGDSLN